MRNDQTTILRGNPRHGFSLVLVMFLFLAFVAAYPLLFRQTESGFYRTRTLYLWSRLQNAAESGLQLANSKGRSDGPGTQFFDYTLQANATLSVQVQYQFVDSGGGTDDVLLATATSFVVTSGVSQPAGFDILKVRATVSDPPGLPSEYTTWTMTSVPQ